MQEEEILGQKIDGHGLGYVLSKRDIRDYKLNKKVCGSVSLPESFEVPHS